MIAQVCNVLVPFLAFLKSYIYALKANNMLVILLDPQFKNMEIIHGFVCNCVAIQIVAKYDIKLVCLFLIYIYSYLNLIKTSMEATNNNDDDTFFGQIVFNDVAIILVLNNELTLIISTIKCGIGQNEKSFAKVGKTIFTCIFLGSSSIWNCGFTNQN